MKSFDIASAIWVVYIVYKELPLWQSEIIEGMYTSHNKFLGEILSGALADLFGRKNIMIVGRICSAISEIVNLFKSMF